jgi:hypothetical protein
MSPKNAAAVALGRKGGQARARNLTPDQRSAAARKAVEARWAKINETLRALEKKNHKVLLRTQKKRKVKKET